MNKHLNKWDDAFLEGWRRCIDGRLNMATRIANGESVESLINIIDHLTNLLDRKEEEETKPNIIEGGIYEYRDKRYKVNTVLPKNLIQFEGDWHPTIRYTLEPQTDLVFYRADVDFDQKFKLITE